MLGWNWQFQKKMNYNIEYEKAVLTAVKQNNAIIDEVDLVPGDFYDKRNGKIWGIVAALVEAGKEANDLTIHEAGVEAAYVASLDSPYAVNWKHCAEKIREHSLRRRYENLQMRLGERLRGNAPIHEINEWLESEMTKSGPAESKSWRECVMEAIVELERRYMSGGGLLGLPSGLVSLDNLTGGFAPRELIVVGARTSTGKTALAINIAAQLAIREKVPVGFISLEMGMVEIVNRLLSQEAGIDLMRLTEGTLARKDFDSLLYHAGKIADMPFMFDDRRGLTAAQIKSKARNMRRRGMRMLFIDYLTLIRTEDSRASRPERVGQIVKELKWLAGELDIPIMVLSQLNREAEGKQPGLEHLRQCGEVEEDSDKIILIERRRDETDAVLHMAKNRNGPTGKVSVKFQRAYARFVEE